MFRTILLLACLFTTAIGIAQPAASKRPKLVVGLVVDQMRWDYLYRYNNRYAVDGGFNRLLNNGYSCENTMIPYTPTLTACGHTSIFTGSVPAIHGITGNDWWDYDQDKFNYCTTDEQEKTVGSATALGEMSPRNLLVTTIGDELRLATNFRSKVIGIAIKDRGAILPAGHSGNGAYWYDNKTGDWISSTYYTKELPQWVKDLNARKLVDKYYGQDWTTLYPINTYEQSATPAGGFNHPLKQFATKNYAMIAATPYGNSFTFEMAMAAVAGEKLGQGGNTDFLSISLSTPDYIGHAYGPNSVEAEDGFLRLDKDLGEFISYLDQKIGKGEYLFFLTADHGAANMPGFLKGNRIPAGNFENDKVTTALNDLLKQKTKTEELVIGIVNNQVYLDRKRYQAAGIKKDSINAWVISYLETQPGINRAFSLENLYATTLPQSIKNQVTNGYYQKRSGDIQLIFTPQWIDSFVKGGTTHGAWNPYDAHIPLLWYGWKIPSGKLNREVYMTDIAPTLAALLQIQMPSGNIGHVIEEIIK